MERQRKTHTITHAMTCKSYPDQVSVALPATLQGLIVQTPGLHRAPHGSAKHFSLRAESLKSTSGTPATPKRPNSRTRETKNMQAVQKDSQIKEVRRRRVWVRMNTRTP